MDTFTQFSSKENLKKAYLYLKDEADESSLSLDPIWRPAISAVGQLEDGFFDSLEKYLRHNKYTPDKADFLYAAKDNLGVRPICIFSVVDRIIYQAILNPQILGNAIDKKLCSFCLGNRMLGKERYLKVYKYQWLDFCINQIHAFDEGYVWRVELDIQTFYESIHLKTLTATLRDNFHIKDKKILEILEQQLIAWSENATQTGLPQGANASAVLANAYLFPLDNFMDDLKISGEFEYFRYVDDIVLMAKDADSLNELATKLVVFLRKYNLRLNEKTKQEKLRNTKPIEEQMLFNPYGEINETSQEKLLKFGKKLPATVKKLKEGKELKKSDFGGLKYYLKAGANLENPKILIELIGLIPTKPSLTFLICRYLGLYLSDLDQNYYELNKEFIDSAYEKVWKIYRDNKLTDWSKFWLFKVLSAPTFSQSHKGFQSELKRVISNPKEKFLLPLAFFYKAYTKEQFLPLQGLGFSLDDIKRHIRNSEIESEKAIYYYFAVYLSDSEDKAEIKELIFEALDSESLEIQLMGIFLVNKLYHLFDISDPVTNAKGILTKFKIDLGREVSGNLSRIYFNLPSLEKAAPTSSLPDQLLGGEGKIAEEKFAEFLGLPQPLKVEVVGLEEGFKGISKSNDDRKFKSPYKIPAGTIWENFIIKFLDDENVHIEVKHLKFNAHYKDMGFIGKGNNSAPSADWAFFKVLALQNGELTVRDTTKKDVYKHQKASLSKKLQNYFSIDYDPFFPYQSSSEKAGDSYKIKITLIPPPES